MARFRKGEFIAKTRNMGYPTKEIAEMLYKDGGEIGQSKVRAMYSYLKKKGLLLSESSECNSPMQNQNYLSELLWHAVLLQFRITDRESIRNTVPLLRKSKTMAAGMLWRCRYSVRIIAVLLYGEDSEQSQKRVWAHISKFMKRMRIIKILRNASGCDLKVKDLR